MKHTPRRVDYIQGSKEWLAWRKTKLTASTAPIIMGDSPWSTKFQLWEEMLNLREPRQTNDAMERGNRLEPVVRSKLELKLVCKFKAACFEHPDIKYLACSLDGISDDGKYIIEIKCPGIADHSIAREGQIPLKYKAQLALTLEVMGFDSIFYASYYEKLDELILIEVKRDRAYIQKLLDEMDAFWNCLQNFSPPELTERDFAQNNSPEWESKAKRYLEVSNLLKSLEKEQEELRLSLIDMADNRSTMGAGLRLTRYAKKGVVQYKNIPELKTVDLNEYRSNTTYCWRVA